MKKRHVPRRRRLFTMYRDETDSRISGVDVWNGPSIGQRSRARFDEGLTRRRINGRWLSGLRASKLLWVSSWPRPGRRDDRLCKAIALDGYMGRWPF